MSKKSESSGTDSSPEKGRIIESINVQPRRHLRSQNLYPNLNTESPHSTNLSYTPESIGIHRTPEQIPLRNKNSDDDDYEDRETSSPSQRGNLNKTPAPPPASKIKPPAYWVFILIALIAALWMFSSKSLNTESQPAVKANCTEFTDLIKTFPNQDKRLFKSLKSGAEGLLDPGEPSVFSFFSTDQKLLSELTKKIVEITKRCIHQPNDPLVLTKDSLNEKIVETYRDELEKTSIMVIENVDDASPQGASHLHCFCDTISPLVPKSIIFLTIQVPEMPAGKPVEYIMEYLQDRWKDLAENIRNPLITRMLDQTFFFKP